MYTSAQASIVATPLARSPSPPLQGPSGHSWVLQLQQQQQQEQELLEPPKHRMCRAVRTVEVLWREWTVGLQGNPSIEVLDRKWGNRWSAGRKSEL
jgi:Transcriptional activator of glycolytic enzymes